MKNIIFFLFLGGLSSSFVREAKKVNSIKPIHITQPKSLKKVKSIEVAVVSDVIPTRLQKKIPAKGTVILVDFGLPSHSKRLWVVKNQKTILNCRVAHGKNSGEVYAKQFSNEAESFKSCIGTFVTGKSYEGEKGLAMRIYGLNYGVNNNAYDRGIVFHGADYVTNEYFVSKGRIGRSLGCFVTEPRYNKEIISLCKNGVKLHVISR
jgi:hypothetical protein